LGEVCVVHFCNFDWLVKKAWMLPHPALSTSVTQNCTSFLNSPIAANRLENVARAASGECG
jgi:hypothetical protein